jgi:hypothetical protein
MTRGMKFYFHPISECGVKAHAYTPISSG